MKKKILMMITLCIGILVGCELSNTPTSKVEAFLSDYQMLEDNITINYNDLSDDTNISTEFQETYKDLIKKQYRNLSYEVKEEVIDGDTATVTTEIKVMDYKKIIDKYDKTMYSTEQYHQLITEDLKNTKETITYTIDFIVLKNNNGDWNLQTITDDTSTKLLGMN